MTPTLMMLAIVVAPLASAPVSAEPAAGGQDVPEAAATQPAAPENPQGQPADSQAVDSHDAERAARLEAGRAAAEAARQAAEEEAALRKAIGRHFMTVGAIYKRYLVPAARVDDAEKFEEGRRRILAINDPLAIPAIVETLSEGEPRIRSLMIETLDGFRDVDEATMYLVVASLLDPDPDLRRLAGIALLKRKDDPRIVEELRRALSSDDEWVLRNAADALGLLKAKEAVPDLIDRLSIEIRIEHPVSEVALFSGVAQAFITGYRAKVARGVAQIEPIVENVPLGLSLGYQEHPVVEYATIYRTEVQEALVEITGVNHGFDHKAWYDWWLRNKN